MGDGDFCDVLSLSPNEFSGFAETSELEIVNIIDNFKNASPGFDDVPMSVVKKTVHEIKHQLVHIFNLSLMLGVFPNKLKIAKVIPIFKKGTKNDMNNYRPISVLPAFSKVLEKIVYNRFIVFIESNNLLSRSQYGFRQNRSTTAAVLQLADHILQEFDKNKFVIGIFLDFTKAFETVDHQILLSKMEHMGVRGVALQWFKNYLENRQQLVLYNKFSSGFLNLEYSVPQGSILGPLLFNIYINDVAESTKNLSTILFADDSCMYFSHNDINSLFNIANEDLKNVENWLKLNRLTLNLNKSHYILFSRRKRTLQNIPLIKINDNLLS